MTERFDLQTTIAALNAGDVVGRRNFEAYRDWAKLERDWLEAEELTHLEQAMEFVKKRNRSLVEALERTRNPSNTVENQQVDTANLSAMARELRALKQVNDASRRDQKALVARLKAEDVYYDAWEARLRSAEEEIETLWSAVEELIRLSSASAPRLEKLEKRVGFRFLRNQKQATSKPNS
jgi:chromosome segregation ATPase